MEQYEKLTDMARAMKGKPIKSQKNYTVRERLVWLASITCNDVK